MNENHNYSQVIDDLKLQISNLGVMRPGTLNRYYPDKDDKEKFYYQVNSTHRGKSHTQYIMPELVPDIEKELVEYKRMKALIDELTHYCILDSKQRIKAARKSAKERKS